RFLQDLTEPSLGLAWHGREGHERRLLVQDAHAVLLLAEVGAQPSPGWQNVRLRALPRAYLVLPWACFFPLRNVLGCLAAGCALPWGAVQLRFQFEDYVLDTDRRESRRGTELVPIAPRVFDLLDYLIRNRERVVSKDDLIGAVWDGRI